MSKVQSLEEIYSPIERQLEAVNQETSKLWSGVFRLILGDACGNPKLGGKLLRPAVCLLAAGALPDQDLERYVPLAAAHELLHLAALAHDDVVDGANLRRGATSLNKLWGNHTAVLGGDLLVAKSLKLMAGYRCFPLMESAIGAISMMAEGELKEFGRGDAPRSRDDCLDLARCKTASLFAVACESPAILIQSPHRTALYEFGMALGIAFQLVDDLLDLTQDTDTLGKSCCTDLTENKYTLPIALMLDHMDAEDRDCLKGMQGKTVDAQACEWVQSQLQSTGAYERTMDIAANFTQQAKGHLHSLPDSPCRDSLTNAADFALTRSS